MFHPLDSSETYLDTCSILWTRLTQVKWPPPWTSFPWAGVKLPDSLRHRGEQPPCVVAGHVAAHQVAVVAPVHAGTLVTGLVTAVLAVLGAVAELLQGHVLVAAQTPELDVIQTQPPYRSRITIY